MKTAFMDQGLGIENKKSSDGKDPELSRLLEHMRLRNMGSNSEARPPSTNRGQL